MEKKYLIVGASAAGMACANSIRAQDKFSSITVLSNEDTPPYFRPMIPFIINGRKKPDEIRLQDSGYFTRNGIQIRLSAGAAALDSRTKKVIGDNGEEFPYDKMLAATGSRPYTPENIAGLETEGVYYLKTLKDALEIAKRTEETDHAVMLGGGILNLKGAFALLEKKVKVSLVVYSPEVLSQLMDPGDALLIREALDRAGLNIITGVSALRILGDKNGVCGVELDNGNTLQAQMVCIGKGVVPNVDFLDQAEINLDSGIITDPYTASSNPDIYAAGDVAVTYDPGSGQKTVTSLWTHAVEMGICAGKNMAGQRTAYAGTLGIMNATQVAGVPVVSMGLVHTKGNNVDTHVEKNDRMLRKIVFSEDGSSLVGALFIGDITNAGIYKYVIREKREVSSIKSHLINHTIHYGHFL